MTFSQVQVIQKVDNAIHWIAGASGFPNTYRLDSDLSGGYPSFQQPRSDQFILKWYARQWWVPVTISRKDQCFIFKLTGLTGQFKLLESALSKNQLGFYLRFYIKFDGNMQKQAFVYSTWIRRIKKG